LANQFYRVSKITEPDKRVTACGGFFAPIYKATQSFTGPLSRDRRKRERAVTSKKKPGRDNRISKEVCRGCGLKKMCVKRYPWTRVYRTPSEAPQRAVYIMPRPHSAKQDMARDGAMQSHIIATMLSLAESERALISQRTREALSRPQRHRQIAARPAARAALQPASSSTPRRRRSAACEARIQHQPPDSRGRYPPGRSPCLPARNPAI
jgi:hypothetical protein